MSSPTSAVAVGRGRLRQRVGGRLGPQRAGARPVDRAVDDDPVQPRAERAAAVEAVERAQRGQERLLRDVLGGRGVVHDEPGRAVGGRPVAAEELVDRVAAPRWAARTSAASVRRLSGRPTRSLPATASCTASSSVDTQPYSRPTPEKPSERALTSAHSRSRAHAPARAKIRNENRKPRKAKPGAAVGVEDERLAAGGNAARTGPRRCSRTRRPRCRRGSRAGTAARTRRTPAGPAARGPTSPAGRASSPPSRERVRHPRAAGRRDRLDTSESSSASACRRRARPPAGPTARPPAAPGPARPRRPSSRGRSTRAFTARPSRKRAGRGAASVAAPRGSRAGARARRPPASAAARSPGRRCGPASLPERERRRREPVAGFPRR